MIISNCCSANMLGEPSNLLNSGRIEGRCADCGEMSSFTHTIKINYINSVFPLGTQDGVDYTIKPIGA